MRRFPPLGPEPTTADARRAILLWTVLLRAALLAGALLVSASLVSACGPSERPRPEPPRRGAGDSQPVTPTSTTIADETGEDRFGLVVVTRSPEAADPQLERLVAQAWFAEHPGVATGDVLSFLRVPVLAEAVPPEVGLCEVSVSDVRGAPTLPDRDGAWIDFVDAGEVVVEIRGAGLPLRAKLLPDLGPELSGIVYDGTRAGLSARDLHGAWRVRADGGLDVGPFMTAISGPEPVPFIGAGGQRAVAGRMASPLRAAMGDGLEVLWRPSPRRREGVVLVEIVRLAFDRMARVVCAATDDGSFTIPADVLRKLPVLGQDQTDRLEIVRFTSRPFSAEGISEGLVLGLARTSVLLD